MSRFLSIAFIGLLSATSLCAQKREELPPTVREALFTEGFLPEDLAGLVVKDDFRTAHNGMHHLFARQRWQGIEVWNGDIAVHTDANGKVIALNNGAWSRMAKRVNATVPTINAQSALQRVLQWDKQRMRVPAQTAFDAELNTYTYDGTDFNGTAPQVQLVLLPQEQRLLLAWNVNYYEPGGAHWWNVRVDAITGKELERNDWVSACGFDEAVVEVACETPEAPMAPPAAPNDYRVYPWPLESPSFGARSIRNAPWTDGGIASPYGWHDTNGAAGAEFTATRGNNVRAVEDADANNTPGYSPTSATLDFDYAIDFTQAPTTYRDAAITNLFYWNNLMHDVWYQYGFDEPAGNFQSNNYGRGGTGNDYVNADAQDGSGTNNANFATPADGSQPRMQMYLWTTTTPQRDGDLDNGIIAHEYTHGISNRLVGGPSNVNCLNNAEQMGEGWSDFYALSLLNNTNADDPNARYTSGAYATYKLGGDTTYDNYVYGIRRFPYSTDNTVNPLTWADTDDTTANYSGGIPINGFGFEGNGAFEVHNIGEVWAVKG